MFFGNKLESHANSEADANNIENVQHAWNLLYPQTFTLRLVNNNNIIIFTCMQHYYHFAVSLFYTKSCFKDVIYE